jgi:hypothetical protein
LRLRRFAPDSTIVAARFTAMPATATAITRPPSTSGGSMSLRVPSSTITAPSASSVAPFSWADRISARRIPNVNPPPAGRRARRAARRASASAPASVSMWAASDSRASEEATMPATTSTDMKPRISASAILSRRASPSAPWPWW